MYLNEYNIAMNTIEVTDEFRLWLKKLKDIRAKTRILARIKNAEQGNFGDYKPLGNNLYEMRIHYAQGYRLYYTQQGKTIYFLLLGGDKSTQEKDIIKARNILLTIEDSL